MRSHPAMVALRVLTAMLLLVVVGVEAFALTMKLAYDTEYLDSLTYAADLASYYYQMLSASREMQAEDKPLPTPGEESHPPLPEDVKEPEAQGDINTVVFKYTEEEAPSEPLSGEMLAWDHLLDD